MGVMVDVVNCSVHACARRIKLLIYSLLYEGPLLQLYSSPTFSASSHPLTPYANFPPAFSTFFRYFTTSQSSTFPTTAQTA